MLISDYHPSNSRLYLHLQLPVVVVVYLDVVDDDPPLAVGVDGPQRTNIAHLRGTEVGLLLDLRQSAEISNNNNDGKHW